MAPLTRSPDVAAVVQSAVAIASAASRGFVRRCRRRRLRSGCLAVGGEATACSRNAGVRRSVQLPTDHAASSRRSCHQCWPMVSYSVRSPTPVTAGSSWHGFLHDGVNFSIPGTGGDECVAFVPPTQKLCETFAVVVLSAIGLWYAASSQGFRLPLARPPSPPGGSGVQQAILVLLCLTFGVEIGYKLSTRTGIWLVNPCHLLTTAQIVLLAAPPDGRRPWVTALFRLQMHALHGAFVALLLPVTNTRELPFEVVVYYVQHVLIVVIPCFLLARGGAYTVEKLGDVSWCAATSALILFFYFVPVQALSVATGVNLNNMLCPAVSDPFHGVNYRLWAIGHSTLGMFTFGKLYTFAARLILSLSSRCVGAVATGGRALVTNGHAKGL